MRINGHGLQREGRAHDHHGRYTGTKVGYGLCACGARSGRLLSTAARQRWHVEHKEDVQEEYTDG